jgi:hypothetical protein
MAQKQKIAVIGLASGVPCELSSCMGKHRSIFNTITFLSECPNV